MQLGNKIIHTSLIPKPPDLGTRLSYTPVSFPSRQTDRQTDRQTIKWVDRLTPACQRSPTVVRTVRGSSPPDCSTPGSQTDTPPTSVGGPLRERDGWEGREGRRNLEIRSYTPVSFPSHLTYYHTHQSHSQAT